MRNRRNYYRILLVQPDAPAEVIEASYKTLMHRLRKHPDLGGDHWNAAVINEAFATLRDPVRRERYDQTLPAQAQFRRPESAPGDEPVPAPEPEPDTPPASPPATGGVPAAYRVAVERDSPTAVDRVMPAPVAETVPPLTPMILCPFCQTRHSVKAAELPEARCAKCRSPLHAVPLLDAPGGSTAKRALERLDRRIPVHVDVASPAPASLEAWSEDLSVHGIGLLLPVRLPIGARIRILCEFCDAVGDVTFVREQANQGQAAWRAGVRFLTCSVRQPRGGLVSLKV